MRWLKKHKYEIITGIQFSLLVYMVHHGFMWTFVEIWLKVGLPIEWYTIVITMVLGLLAVFGVLQWISKTEKKLEASDNA